MTQLFRQISDDAYLLKSFAMDYAEDCLNQVNRIDSISPFRHMTTRRGFQVSVPMTNCGEYGWVSDSKGYRYDKQDPLTKQAWPSMPAFFQALATTAAIEAGFNLTADCCLLNRYQPGMKLGLHRDADERDATAPIVSVSFGITATFLFGGIQRNDNIQAYEIEHGDVVVWGGCSRYFYHGIKPIKQSNHPLTGAIRYNLSFRQAM